MATEKQIAANRRNSLKSTGPKTSRGKAASCQNSFRHGLRSTAGILPGESSKELAQILDQLQISLRPTTEHQHLLVEQMAHAEWRLRYWQRIETKLLAQAF